MKTPGLIPLIFVCQALAGWAAPTSWIGVTDGRWDDAGSWSAGVPDPSTESTSLVNGGSKTVVLDPLVPVTQRTVQRLEIGGVNGAVNTLRLEDLGEGALQVMDSLNLGAGGALEIANSRLEFDGRDSGGTFNLNAGRLSLMGGDLRVWATAARVGRTGDGTAVVQAGTFQVAGDLLVGDLAGSSGSLILEGGTSVVEGQLYLADDIGSRGLIRVQGGALRVVQDTFRVGDDGVGALEITAGAVEVGDVSVGRGPGADGRLDLSGGNMACGDLSLGRFAGARGLAEVSGGILSLPVDTLFVGREGAGVLRISDGEVNALELVVAAAPGATGLLELSGGLVRVGHLSAERPEAELRMSGGRLEITSASVHTGRPVVIGDGIHGAILRLNGGTHSFADGLIIAAGARLEGTGTVVGPLTVEGVDAREGVVPAAPRAPVLTWIHDVDGRGLTAASEPGRHYQLESVDAGPWGAWQPVGPAVAGNGATLRWSVDTADLRSRVFRVRVD